MLTQRDVIAAIPDAFAGLDDPTAIRGKVRDSYIRGANRILVTSDRVSAFDKVVGLLPFKGQLLNQLSAWWFDQLKDIVPSHLVSIPDPNITVAREAKALPVEIVVRGHITGSTSTSLWMLHKAGVELPYGLKLPRNLRKNDRLPAPVITPTTKAPAGQHDERLTEADIVERGLVPGPLWVELREVALAVFARGQQRADAAGLVLVDTKYEFGLIDGRLALIDEVHTPDCSRYWRAADYDKVRGQGADPGSLDKEHLRLWFAARGYKGDGPPPALPPDLVAGTMIRYIEVFERLTGCNFAPGATPIAPRVRRALELLQ